MVPRSYLAANELEVWRCTFFVAVGSAENVPSQVQQQSVYGHQALEGIPTPGQVGIDPAALQRIFDLPARSHTIDSEGHINRKRRPC